MLVTGLPTIIVGHGTGSRLVAAEQYAQFTQKSKWSDSAGQDEHVVVADVCTSVESNDLSSNKE